MLWAFSFIAVYLTQKLHKVGSAYPIYREKTSRVQTEASAPAVGSARGMSR